VSVPSISSSSTCSDQTITCNLALPCNSDGNFLPPGTPPSHQEAQPQGDWAPFHNKVQFELADFLFHDAELSVSKVDVLLDLWTQSLSELDAPGPMRDHKELHALKDSSTLGDVPWQYMVTCFDEDGEHTSSLPTPWSQTKYEVWYHNPNTVVSNMLANPDFNGQFDVRPYIDLDEHQKRCWSNVMSGNIAWRCSVSRIISIS
jgi:hypothetical protein